MTGVMMPWRALAVAAGVLALQGCAQERQVQAPTARVYAVDLQGGARLCTVPTQVGLAADKPAETTMVMGNDGGWCGITVAQPGSKPYASGLVAGRPAHGRLNIHKVGDATRIDYTPDRGFAGTDSFAVRLLPGDAALKVAVTVQPGQPSLAEAPQPAAQPAATPAAAPAPAAARSAGKRTR